MRHPVVAALLAASFAVPSLGFAQTPPAAQAVPVGVVAAALRAVTGSQDFVGRVEAIERVAIRARVTGYLKEVLFKEGDVVQEGAPLYRIEPEPFQAALQQARGALLQAQATYTNANLQRARADELVKTAATARSTLDERVAAEQSAQGSVVRADADVKTATINLTYTEIAAPITGKIGRTAVTRGNVVSPDSGVLATIVSQDPTYVVFPVSQRVFLQIRQAGDKASKPEDLVVKLVFADGSTYAQAGRIDFVDVTVDRSTDSVTVRAVFPNPDGHLVDGTFLRVAVSLAKPEEKLVVPQAALIVDQEGPYVFVVVDGKAAIRRVKIGAETGRDMIVESGLKAGESVVVEGLQAIRPGAAVVASPVQGL